MVEGRGTCFELIGVLGRGRLRSDSFVDCIVHVIRIPLLMLRYRNIITRVVHY
jgi:hypothetical protein